MTTGPMSYLRTYYSGLIWPAVTAIGMQSKRYRSLMWLGFSGALLSYMIDGSKSSLLLPIALFGLMLLYKLNMLGAAMLTWGMAGLFVVCGLLGPMLSGSGLRQVIDLVALRTFAIPGQTFQMYHDLFTEHGFTFWSNTRFINQFVPPPDAYAGDPMWPVLGRIVGQHYFGFENLLNANANLFSGEGVAAAGPLGVLVIAAVLAVWLRAYDQFSRGWPRLFVAAPALSLGIALTNIHLTTLLLSFGGVLIIVLLAVAKKPVAPRRNEI